MNDIFERNHPMKDNKEFITSYWTDRAKDFGALRAKELESPKLKLWIDELTSHIFDSDRSLRILDIGCGAGFFSIFRGACCFIEGVRDLYLSENFGADGSHTGC